MLMLLLSLFFSLLSLLLLHISRALINPQSHSLCIPLYRRSLTTALLLPFLYASSHSVFLAVNIPWLFFLYQDEAYTRPWAHPRCHVVSLFPRSTSPPPFTPPLISSLLPVLSINSLFPLVNSQDTHNVAWRWFRFFFLLQSPLLSTTRPPSLNDFLFRDEAFHLATVMCALPTCCSLDKLQHPFQSR